MNAVSRRSFASLLGFAAAPATGTAAAALATAPAVIGENPELLSIAGRLDKLEADLAQGEQEHAAAVAHYDATKPTPPPELSYPHRYPRSTDLNGRLCTNLYDSVHDRRNEYCQLFSGYIKVELESLPPRSRSKRAVWLRERLAQAAAYEATCDEAWEEYCRRCANYNSTRSAIEKLGEQVATMEAATLAGVVTKARVMLLGARIEEDRRMQWHARQIAPGLAADLVRVTQGGPQS